MPDESFLPDSSLARKIKNSDAEAFKILFYRYAASLYRFILFRIRSKEFAQDLVQEVFTRVWQNRRKIDAQKSLKAYLYRIANNLVIDELRKTSHKQDYLARLQSESAANSIETQTMLDELYNQMPKSIRTVFMLSRFEGLKYAEIAEVCSISIKAVESRMSKALQFLRKNWR